MANQSLNIPYITLTGAVIIALVVAFTVLQPMTVQIQASRSQLAGSALTLSAKETFLRSLDRKRQELQIQRVHEERLNVMFPTDEAYDDAIRVIASAATKAGVTVQKIDNKSAAIQGTINAKRSRGEVVNIPETVTPLAAEVDMLSSYQQFRAFLENLETSPRLTDVVKITALRPNDKPEQLATKMLLQFYYRGK